jgi:hypothetical protein
MIDFHETHYEHNATRGHSTSLPFNILNYVNMAVMRTFEVDETSAAFTVGL